MKPLSSLSRSLAVWRFPTLWLGVILTLGTFVSSGYGAGSFLGSLDKNQRTELGLDRLTAAELSALDAAIQAYMTGTIAEVRRKDAVENLGRVPKAGDVEIRVESHIAGPFFGWRGSSVFNLANGQVWQQVGPEEYYHPYPDGVDVTIFPASFGSFRMKLPTGATVGVVRRR